MLLQRASEPIASIRSTSSRRWAGAFMPAAGLAGGHLRGRAFKRDKPAARAEPNAACARPHPKKNRLSEPHCGGRTRTAETEMMG